MTIIDKKIWIILLVLVGVALVSSAAVFGGIEGAFASMGAMVLIGITVIAIRMLLKAMRYSKLSLRAQWSDYDDTDSRFAEAGPVTGRDKRIILKHINELFDIEEPVRVVPISLKDKRMILRHIDELFVEGVEQSNGIPAEVRPVSKADKREIMRYIDDLFTIDQEHSGERYF